MIGPDQKAVLDAFCRDSSTCDVNRRTEQKEPSSQISVMLTDSEKDLLREAAKAAGVRYLSGFIRDAVLERAFSIVGHKPAPEISQPDLKNGYLDVLYAYVGNELPDDCQKPPVLFPSIRSFASVLSDRNRAILRWLARNEAEPILQLANVFDMPYQTLSRTMKNMSGYGLIRYKDGPNKTKVPRLACKSLTLNLAFGSSHIDGVLQLAVNSADDEAPASGADRVLTSIDELSRAIPGRHGHKVLHTLGRRNPDSIAALGRLTNEFTTHNYIYRLIEHASQFGLVAFEEGYTKKPFLNYDGIRIDILF